MAELSVTADSGVHAFDFLHGSWAIHNRRLDRPLTGSTAWYEFEARSVERPLWGGRANIEEYEAVLPDGSILRGLALRLFDVRANRWTIHWSNAAAGTLDEPMVGSFVNGLGTFYGHDIYRGQRVFARFLWTNRGANEARWVQAFSPDDGATWETNWIMHFTRVADAAAPSFERSLEAGEQ